MTDEELRWILAQEVIDVLWTEQKIKAYVCKERCPDCRSFLVEIGNQQVPHCWFCTADHKNVERGRKILAQAEYRHAQIVIDERRKNIEKELEKMRLRDDDGPGRNMMGMPL